jgi:hypothetical protein
MTGVVVAGGLSGCASRVASQVTNTGASPAAVFAGDDESVGEPHVSRLTPTLSGGSGLFSGDVGLEAWVTAIAMENYNSPRSNRSIADIDDPDLDDDGVEDGVDSDDDVRGEDYNSPRNNRSAYKPVDIIDDDVDEDDETFRTALELEAEVQDAADRAVLAISKRSARTGRNPETDKEITEAIDEMDEHLAALRAELERCSDEPCVEALENVAEIEDEVSHAREHVADEQWSEAVEAVGGDGNDILVGDYLVAPGVDPSNEERDALVEYLYGSPMVGERFAVCLPDTEVPGGNESLAQEVTPQRFIEYMTGRASDDGKVYAWGNNTKAADGGEDCDDTDPDIHPGQVCGDTEHLSAAISGPVETGGGLVSLSNGGGTVTVTVVNTPPTVSETDMGPSTLVCPVDSEAYEPSDLSGWGSESGESSETPTIVCQVMVQPPECPVPVRALLYVKRCRSNEQLVYTGGWVLDEAGLFEESVTALTVAGETQVVGVDASGVGGDHDGDGLSDFLSRAVSGERARRGARIDSATVEELVEAGVLADGEVYCWGKVSSSKAESGSCGDTHGADGDVVVTHCPLDAPVLHLVIAGSASNEVKFKAGAELSKSVN